MATGDQSPIRGLDIAGTLFVAAYLALSGRRNEPAHGALEDCLTFCSAPGRTGRRVCQDGAGTTSLPIAQMKPHISRAMAVTTTVGRLPVALSLR